jgi:hypothetical protein
MIRRAGVKAARDVALWRLLLRTDYREIDNDPFARVAFRKAVEDLS